MAISADSIYWKLSEIRQKVRKLTGRPSTNQISDNEVDKYINRFYTQDLIALLDLREVDSWWRFETLVNVPNYSNLEANFTLEGPLYINGEEIPCYRDPKAFFSLHPQLYKSRENIGTGDASTTTFTGSLSKSVVNPENIVIDDDVEVLRVQSRPKIVNVSKANPAVVTTDAAHGLTTGDSIRIMDMTAGMVEVNNIQTTATVLSTTTFQLDNIDSTAFTTYTGGGSVYPVEFAILAGDQGGSGRITLSSGAYSVTFNTAPASDQDIRASYEFSNAARPVAALFYDNELLLSPVPDGSYLIQVAVNGRPAPLLADTDTLAFDDWGKLVAYGASIDIMNDNGQQEGAILLERQFRMLQSQALRRNIRETANERSIPQF